MSENGERINPTPCFISAGNIADKYDGEPIRSVNEIEDMKQSLRKWCGEKYRFMFVFGIYTGLRVSDILLLKVADIRGKDHAALTESKSNKKRRVI